MAETTAAAKAAAQTANRVVLDHLKTAGKTSLALGVGVAAAALAVQVTIIAGQAAIGASQGFVAGIKASTIR